MPFLGATRGRFFRSIFDSRWRPREPGIGRHAPGGGPGRQSPWLEHHDPLIAEPRFVEQGERYDGRLAVDVGWVGFVEGGPRVDDGNWHHVAVVYDPAAPNSVSLYVDGVLDVAGNTEQLETIIERKEALLRAMAAHAGEPFLVAHHLRDVHLPYDPAPPFDIYFRETVAASEQPLSAAIGCIASITAWAASYGCG